VTAAAVLSAVLIITLVGAAGLAGSQYRKRIGDEKEARAAWTRLVSAAARPAGNFDPATIAHLPEPARRFFRFAIEPGARLASVVEISMEGELSLGSKQDPKYQPMRADQVLAAPHGMVWLVHAGAGASRISGSDGMVDDRSWTRFWLLGTVPVVRAGGDLDHLRSSFGRVVAEAAFWAPASLLPQAGVTWTRRGRRYCARDRHVPWHEPRGGHPA
jgi:hypothetical protein